MPVLTALLRSFGEHYNESRVLRPKIKCMGFGKGWKGKTLHVDCGYFVVLILITSSDTSAQENSLAGNVLKAIKKEENRQLSCWVTCFV